MGLARKIVVRGINCLAVATQAPEGWRVVGFVHECMIVTDHSATEVEAYRSWERRAVGALRLWTHGNLFAEHARPIG
jgi:phage terminase large subunit-like protein